MRRLIGIGYREPLANWIDSNPPEIECLEITAEHFFDGNKERLVALAKRYPLFVHGLGLSLGTPGALDARTLQQFREVVAAAGPEWISEHIAFTRTSEVDLGHLNPLPPTREMLEVVADHAIELAEACERFLILENITSFMQLEGEMSETEFLNRLCERARCGLLLDVTNLFINSRNFGFDPRAWLRELDPAHIVQLHIVGYSVLNGRLEDHHGEAVQDDLLDLLRETLAYANVQAIILERDLNLKPESEIARELLRLESAVA